MLRQKTTLIALILGAFVLLIGIAAAILIPRGTDNTNGDAAGNGDYLPFGEEGDSRDLSGLFPEEETSGPGGLPSGGSGQPVLRQTDLRQITEAPVAGAWAYTNAASEEEAYTFVRYTDRSTGHIYELNLDSISPAQKVTQVTVPRLQEALWASTGSSTVLRYLNETAERVRTFAADLVPVTSSEGDAQTAQSDTRVTFDGAFLRDDIISLAFSPDGSSLFFLVAPEGGARGFLTQSDGEGMREVFRSPLRELRAAWPSSNQILVTTKASAEAPGFAFSVNPQTGFSDPILSNQIGLTARMNRSGDRVAFFSKENNSPLLRILSLADNTMRRMPLVTLPDDKCVWSRSESHMLYCAVPARVPSGTYPDDWYRGEMFTEDVIWRINTETSATDLLVAPASASTRVGVDAINLFLDDAERHLFFTNKRDGTLWSLRIDTLLTETFPID